MPQARHLGNASFPNLTLTSRLSATISVSRDGRSAPSQHSSLSRLVSSRLLLSYPILPSHLLSTPLDSSPLLSSPAASTLAAPNTCIGWLHDGRGWPWKQVPLPSLPASQPAPTTAHLGLRLSTISSFLLQKRVAYHSSSD